MLPARAISTKNKHLLAIYSIPARGFTAAVSVFGGTPPTKPLKCKIRFALASDAIDHSWAHHTGDQLKLVVAKFNLSPEDIIKMSFRICSPIVCLLLTAIRLQSCTENKKPCSRSGKQGGEILFVLRYLLASSPSKLTSVFFPIDARDRPGPNAQPGLYRP
jgi:hypothetical protein